MINHHTETLPAGVPWWVAFLPLALFFGFFAGRFLYGVYQRAVERWAIKCLSDFAREFPGRCFICSYHYYGWTHGYESSPTPEPHECIEGRR